MLPAHRRTKFSTQPTNRRRSLLLAASLLCAVAAPSFAPTTSVFAQDVVKRKKKRPAKIDWAKDSSKNYDIRYESVIPTDVVLRVKKELEDILVQYTKLFRYQHKDKFRVKILENLPTWEYAGGTPSMAGFYSPGNRVLFLRSDLPYYRLIPTVYHEAFHQYIHAYVGDGVHIPIWYNEGMAKYYEGMERDKNKAKTLNPKKINKRKLRMVKDAIRTRSEIELATLVDATHEQFHEKEKEALYYHQSFAVMFYFMETTRGRAAVKYANALRDKKDVEAANAIFFGKDRKNLKRVAVAWKKFTLNVDHDALLSK